VIALSLRRKAQLQAKSYLAWIVFEKSASELYKISQTIKSPMQATSGF